MGRVVIEPAGAPRMKTNVRVWGEGDAAVVLAPRLWAGCVGDGGARGSAEAGGNGPAFTPPPPPTNTLGQRPPSKLLPNGGGVGAILESC